MLDQNWESLFSPPVLLRGYRYYEDGLVTRIKPVDGGWQALVEGTQDYNVFIADKVVESACDCPFYLDHGLCKHIAAVCYEIDNENDIWTSYALRSGNDIPDCRPDKAQLVPTKPSAEAIVNELSHEQQQAFLSEIVRNDPHWQEVTIRRFGRLDDALAKADFLDGVWRVVRECSYRGFVDYRNAYRCEIALCEYVNDFFWPLMERGAYNLVLELTFTFELSLQKIAIDDSGGFFTSMIILINGYWEELLAKGGSSLGRVLFEWLCALVCTDDDTDDEVGILWSLQENAREFIKTMFATDTRFAHEVVEFADAQLESLPSMQEAETSITTFDRALWSRIKLQAMVTLDLPFSELEAFADEQPPSYEITRLLVDRAKQLDLDREAIQLLRTYIDHTETRNYPTEAALELLKLLRKHGPDEEVIELYLELIVNGREQNADQLRSWIRKVRKRSGAKWPELKAQLINRLGDNHRRLEELYAAEGDLSELMGLVQAHGSIADLDYYKDMLADAFPQEFLSRYKTLVRQQVFNGAANRSAYRRTVDLLKKMQAIPGGQEAATRIVEELLKTYPRRTALKDELKRLL